MMEFQEGKWLWCFDAAVAREAIGSGFSLVEVVIKSWSHAHPGDTDIWVQMVDGQTNGRLLGIQMVGREGVAHRINALAVALFNRMTVADFAQTDLAYAPPSARYGIQC